VSDDRGGRAVAQYLARHAEPEARHAATLGERFDHVVVIPAMAEDPALLDAVEPSEGSALAIVVLNAPAGDPTVVDHNARTLAALARQGDLVAIADDPPLVYGHVAGRALLVIDRSSGRFAFEPRYGVGLARKIGCDLALALWARGRIASRFIHWGDGDARMPEGALAAADDASPATVLLTYPFRHVASGDDVVDRAHFIYEASLRYYVLGLHAAGSPYAAHAIGSSMAVAAEAYAAIRGVPRQRRAAEDFYLVSKVMKIGASEVPRSPPIEILARPSARVPFGTGRATGRIVQGGADRFMVDPPRAFALLGQWLRALERYARGENDDPVASACADLPRGEADLLGGALGALGAPEACRAARSATRRERLLTRLWVWFDAFRTLKLVHALRDGLPTTPDLRVEKTAVAGLGGMHWLQALESAPFIPPLTSSDPLTLCRTLAELEPQGAPGAP
jgi:hypothetical protein